MRSRCSEDPRVLNKMNGITTAGVDSLQGCRRPGLRTLPCRHSSRELTPQLTAEPWRDGPVNWSSEPGSGGGRGAQHLPCGWITGRFATAAVSAHLRVPLCSASVTCSPTSTEQPPTDREARAPAGPPSANTWPWGSVADPSPQPRSLRASGPRRVALGPLGQAVSVLCSSYGEEGRTSPGLST